MWPALATVSVAVRVGAKNKTSGEATSAAGEHALVQWLRESRTGSGCNGPGCEKCLQAAKTVIAAGMPLPLTSPITIKHAARGCGHNLIEVAAHLAGRLV